MTTYKIVDTIATGGFFAGVNALIGMAVSSIWKAEVIFLWSASIAAACWITFGAALFLVLTGVVSKPVSTALDAEPEGRR